ncbi:MAG: hypothetical protein Q9181_004793 [Wetmoreana brouardii]
MSRVSNLTTTDPPLWDTPENHGPLVSVLTWFLVITSFLAVTARVATRYAVIRQLRADDATIMAAMLLSIGESITTSLQASNGLGKHIGSISPHKVAHFQKSLYAAGFLYIGTVSLVKLSICLLLNNLTPVQVHQTFIRVLGAFTVLWMISSFFVIGFRCHLASAWQTLENRCIDITAFWAYYHIVNILTDLTLIGLPWVIVSNLQVEARRKAIIIGCFAARILVVAITILQIYYLLNQSTRSRDITFDLWRVVLLGEVVLALSLLTACIPYLKPLMQALEIGMIRAGGGAASDGHAFGYGHRSTSHSRKYGALSRLSNKPSRAQLSGVRMDSLGFAGEKDDQYAKQTATVSAGGHARADSDEYSQTSQSRIIRKTVGWSVTEEPQISLPPNTHLERP